MKSISKYIITPIAMLCLAASCSEEQSTTLDYLNGGSSETTQPQITLAATNLTRTSIDGVDVSWAVGDTMAVVAGAAVDEAPAKFSILSGIGGNEGRFSGVLTPSNSYLYSFYPYSDQIQFSMSDNDVYCNFTQPALQVQNYLDGKVDATSIGDYNYMWGKSTEEISEDNTLSSISMTHLMSILDLNFESTPVGRKITSVEISTSALFVSKASLNMESGDVSEYWNLSSIKIELSGNEWTLNESVRVAIIPQTIEVGTKWTITVSYDSGDPTVKEITFSDVRTYEVGKRYQSEVINLSGLVADDYPAVGDYFFEDGSFSKLYTYNDSDTNPCIGLIHYIDPTDPFAGKVVSLYQTVSTAWATEQVTTSASSTDDGLVNMATIAALRPISEWAEYYPAFNYIHEMNDAQTTYSSGTVGIWYLPAFNEIRELYCAVCGTTLVYSGSTDLENGIVSNVDWGEDTKQADLNTNPSIYRTAKEAFLAKITGAGGDAYALWNLAYWSSTEQGVNNAKGVWFDGGSRSNQAKTYTDTKMGIRAIRLFEKTTKRERF